MGSGESTNVSLPWAVLVAQVGQMLVPAEWVLEQVGRIPVRAERVLAQVGRIPVRAEWVLEQVGRMPALVLVAPMRTQLVALLEAQTSRAIRPLALALAQGV